MDKEKIWRSFLLIMLIVNIICWVPLGAILWDYYGPDDNKAAMELTNLPIESCINLTLKQTAHCMVTITKPIYKYNITPDSWDLTFKELKSRGGDCKDWTEYYISIADTLGFYADLVKIDVNKTAAHDLTVISNEEGYCIIDQLYYICTPFK